MRVALLALVLCCSCRHAIRVKAPAGIEAALAAGVYDNVFPPGTTYKTCWTSQDPSLVHCRYVVEAESMDFRLITVRARPSK